MDFQAIDLFSATLLLQVSSTQNLSLAVGILVFIVGVMSMFSHRRAFDAAFEQQLTAQQVKFENRKYRRRVMVAGMITSLGIMIAAIYWVREPPAFACLILIILGILLSILGTALIDMYSVGLQALARTDEPDRKKLIEQYLKERQQQAESQKED